MLLLFVVSSSSYAIYTINNTQEQDMDIKDVIRAVLDILDQHEAHDKEMYDEPDVEITGDPEEVSRFRQIFDLLDKGENSCGIANAPNEKYADIDAVTTLAGGGINGPKHPADIRVKDSRGYE
jgi:hypothetical protein